MVVPIVLLAELGGLALDAYLAMETHADFTIDSAAANTSIDPSLALANEEPSLTWLAVELVATGLGTGFAIKTFREAARLHRAVEAGESAQAAIRYLDTLGEEHRIGKIGSRIVKEAGDGTGMAHRTTRPALYSDRVGEYAAENVAGLARRLGTGVEVDPSLGSGVRIDRFVHDDGDVWVIGLRVGPDAITADVLAHRKTIELMRRYNGTIGDLRAVLDRGLGKTVHEAGSPQEIASLEAEKLHRLICERQEALSARTVDDVTPVLEQELAFLRKELIEWEARLLSKQPREVVAGFGEIASPTFSKTGDAKSKATKAKRLTPGVDGTFRGTNPAHPPNAAAQAAMDEMTIFAGMDCSEIAEDLLEAASGAGKIIHMTPQQGHKLKLMEYGKVDEGYVYHEVYTDGKYVFDPRLNDTPVPHGDWMKLMKHLNPGARFQ